MIQLVGIWEGTGIASYPTIDTTPYREVLTVQQQDDIPRLFYEQKTWRTVDSTEQILHWETGFIRHLENETYEWINSQNNGRLELMHGVIKDEASVVSLLFKTVTFVNDPRMLAATRHLTISQDALHYQHMMATQTHDAQQHLHLEAHLKRKS